MALVVLQHVQRVVEKNSANTAIAEADAREKRKWRYVIWGWRMFQLLCQLYLATLVLRFVLS